MPADEKSIPQVLTELWELTLSYAKQETVEPLKGLGRFIGIGVAAVVLASTGIILVTLGVLRVLQVHSDEHLAGNWNWVPYLVALIVLGVLIVIAVSRIKAKGATR